MSKIALLNDSHAGVRNDAKWIVDFQEKFYKEIFFPYCLKNGITDIFHLGDLFDRRKYINFGTLNRWKSFFFDPMRDYGINMTVIPGNHDTFSKTNNEVNSLQELLYGYANIKIINEPTVTKVDDVSFMWLPWLNNENYKSSMEYIDNNEADILLGHLELSGFGMHDAHSENTTGMSAELFKKFKMVLSGHYHYRSNKGNVHYLGIQYEMISSDQDQQKGFHVYDTETKQLEFVPNPFKLFEKIFYSDESFEEQKTFAKMDVSPYNEKIVKLYVNKKKNSRVFEGFVERLMKQNLIDLQIMEDYSEFHESSVEDIVDIRSVSTRELMEKYVDSAETEMDKNRLKTILGNLYTQALHYNNDSL